MSNDDFLICESCGRMYKGISFRSRGFCFECRQKEEEKFQMVKEYLREHSNTTLQDMSKETGVPIKILCKWIEEKRLVMAEGSGSATCEKCGKNIVAGRYCVECKQKLFDKINNEIKKDNPNPFEEKENKFEGKGNRMRFN
ncbi:MAG: hypothetical protein K6G26_04345 [Lachnospiraceae bacterium]|nr:hypothetical protein [Lachnospiraceae bacterium]